MSATKQERLEELQSEWLDLRERAQAPAPSVFAEHHPEHAEALRTWFSTLELLECALAPDPGVPTSVGDYDIVGEVGRGAMGIVYEATQRTLGRQVALKVLSPQVAGSRRAVERFRREARAAAKIKHHSLLPIYDVGQAAGFHYYAMELVEGRSLEAEIKALGQAGHPGLLGLGRARLDAYVEQFAGLCDAVQAAHDQGVLHRDIKPSNVLVGRDGRMKLVDFGLAREEAVAGLTRTGDFMGTPLYMSPEQLKGSLRTMDARSDVYALGITLYELVTLRPPYQATSVYELAQRILTIEPEHPRALGIDVPRELEAIIYRAIERDPQRRYATAAAMAADLRAFLASKPVSAAPQTAFVRLRKRLKRNRVAVRTAALTLTVTLAMFALVFGVPALRDYLLRREALANDEARVAKARALVDEADRTQGPAGMRLLEEVKAQYEDTPSYIAALRRIGDRLRAAGDREGAQLAWAAAHATAPTRPEALRAFVRLGRTFQDVGRTELSRDIAETALTLADGPVRAQALLLAAEARLSDGSGLAQALGYLEACEAARGDLPAADRERLRALREIVNRFGPCLELDLEPARVFDAGVFWHADGKDVPGVLLVGNEVATVYPVIRGRLAHEGAVSWKLLDKDSAIRVVDLDGHDGLKEVVEISFQEDLGDDQVMRVISLKDGKATLREQRGLALPYAHYEPCAHDLDGDGTPELILGVNYPGEGVLILARGKDGRYRRSELPVPKELAGERSPNNVRDIAIGDLDENGHPEMAVACAEYRIFALKLYEYANGWHARETSQSLAGSIGACEFLPRDGARPPWVVFAPYAFLAEGVGPRYASFLPQGVYALLAREKGGDLELRALDAAERLSLAPRGAHGIAPWNVGTDQLHVGRLDPGRSFYAARETSSRVKEPRFHYAMVRALDGAPGRGFLLRRLAKAPVVQTLDCDGDGREEILLFDLQDGTLYVQGIGSLPPSDSTVVHRSRIHVSDDETALRFQNADRLLRMDFPRLAAQAYDALRERVKGGPLEERAFLGHVRALARGRDYDRSIAELRTWCDEGRDSSRQARLKLATYCERIGRLGEAAGYYSEAAKLGVLDDEERNAAARRAQELAPWQALPAATPLPIDGRWTLPADGDFRVDANGGLVFESERAPTLPVVGNESWHGESFQLSFDLEVHTQAVGRNLGVGFVSELRGADRPDAYVIARVSSTSGQYRNVSILTSRPGDQREHCVGADETPGHGLPLNRPYRFVLIYDAAIDRLQLTVREIVAPPARGKLYAALECTLGAPDMPAMRMALGLGLQEWEQSENYTISNVRIVRPQ